MSATDGVTYEPGAVLRSMQQVVDELHAENSLGQCTAGCLGVVVDGHGRRTVVRAEWPCPTTLLLEPHVRAFEQLVAQLGELRARLIGGAVPRCSACGGVLSEVPPYPSCADDGAEVVGARACDDCGNVFPPGGGS